jgi:N-acetylmuramoyl-L-alanine amidase
LYSIKYKRLLLLSVLLIIILLSAACSKRNDDALSDVSDPINTNEENDLLGDDLTDSSEDDLADTDSSIHTNPSDGFIDDSDASVSSDPSDSASGISAAPELSGSPSGSSDIPNGTSSNSDNTAGSADNSGSSSEIDGNLSNTASPAGSSGKSSDKGSNSNNTTSSAGSSDKSSDKGSNSNNTTSSAGSSDKSTDSSSSSKKTNASEETRIIAIDAGHQSKGNYQEEPIGPGAKKTKPKVTTGTQGISTGVPEYKLTLVIAKKVKEELINRGYEIVMIRDSHDVNLSNKERAEIANESGADLFIRIHADGSENSNVSGVSTLYPSKDNPYVSKLSKSSYALSTAIVDGICDSTGAKNRGAIARDDMSGINWCTIPVSIIEMGYMSNKAEDKNMQTEDYQNKIVEGICNGIDDYYNSKE